jgi:hypothetical protein
LLSVPSAFLTWTGTVPAVAIAASLIVALAPNVVASSLPAAVTIAPSLNPVPATVSTNPVVPAVTVAGLIELITGAAGGAGVTLLAPAPYTFSHHC